MKYTVEFYRMVTVQKEIEADSKEELEKKCKKMKKDVMKNIPSHISQTEWEVIEESNE